MGISNQIPPSRLIQPGVCTSSTRPASPFEGQVIYETDTKRTLVWQGSAWVMLTDADTPPAMELVKVQTIGSSVGTVTMTDAFSSTWDNYRIVVSGGTQSINGATWLQLGSSSSNYNTVLIYGNTAGTPALAGNSNASFFSWVGGGTGGQQHHLTCDLFGPFLTQYTKMRNGGYADSNNFGVSNGEHTLTTSYSSFTIGLTGGTLTGGTIRVYGYRNAI